MNRLIKVFRYPKTIPHYCAHTHTKLKCAFSFLFPSDIAGMDQKPGFEGGTWLAMNCTEGHVAVLLNVRQPQNAFRLEGVKGRGHLVPNFLHKLFPQPETISDQTGRLKSHQSENDDQNETTAQKTCASSPSPPPTPSTLDWPSSFSRSAEKYFSCLQRDRNEYNGFVFVTFQLNRLVPKYELQFYHSAQDHLSCAIDSGLHAFGNNRNVGLPWPKMEHGRKLIGRVLSRHNQLADDQNIEHRRSESVDQSNLIEDLFAVFQDRTRFEIEGEFQAQMPEMSLKEQKQLSSISLHMPQLAYGSRYVSTVDFLINLF